MDLKEILIDESCSGFDVGALNSDGLRDKLNQHPSGARLALSLERLRRRHLLRRGSYFWLRCFLPAPVLTLVWLEVVHFGSRLSLPIVMNYSVTLRHLLLGMGIALLWNINLLLRPLRQQPAIKDIESEVRYLISTSFLCGLLLFLGNVLRSTSLIGVELGLLLAVMFSLGSLVLLGGALVLSADLLPDPSRTRRALIIGSGPRAAYLRAMTMSSHDRLEIAGCLDNEYVGDNRAADRYLGPLDHLAAVLKAEPVELVLIGLPIKSMYDDIQKVITVCESVGVESHYMSDVFVTTRVSQQVSPASSQFTVLGYAPHDVRRWMKRAIDLLVAAPLFVLLQPLFLVIAIAIKLTSPGPVFFVQQRYGMHRQKFHMFKFRTMVVDAEQRQAELETINEAQGPVFKLKSDPRVTKVGAFLRRTSLDELPQLINVLRGEMSLVGPRPLPLRDVSLFEESWLLRRFSVTPGLTCLWQVRGRSNTMFDEWMKLDMEYIDNWSLGLDFKIIVQTVPAILKGSGAM